MYWFWYFMYTTMPALLLPGMLGGFGAEAKRAADDFVEVLGLAFLAIAALAIIGGAVYGVLKLSGLIN